MDNPIGNQLLLTLSQCAGLLNTDRAAALPKLREAAALYWRLNPSTPLLTPLEMEAQLYLPLEDWLDESTRGAYTGTLSIGGQPSPTCTEMALELDPAAGAEEVQKIIKRVRDTLRLRVGGDQNYRRFRSYVIEHPTVERDSDIHDVLVPLGVGLAELYAEIPEHLKRNGQVYPCPVCGWPMILNSSPVSCGSLWCRAMGGNHDWTPDGLINNGSGKIVAGHVANSTLMLRPAIWKFTLVPGLLELSIARRIEEIGLEAILWPDVDTSDVRTFVDGKTINIDAKVWYSASRLATHLKSLSSGQACWIVIPDYMERDISYLREQSPPQIAVFTESGCIREIRKQCIP